MERINHEERIKRIQRNLPKLTRGESNILPIVEEDVKELYKNLELYQRLATIDTLTGLLNLRGLEGDDNSFSGDIERLLSIARRNHEVNKIHIPISLSYIDVCGLKYVNDYISHKAGDDLLLQTAQALQKVAKRGSDLIARIGGDEFLIVLPYTTADNVENRIQSLRDIASNTDTGLETLINGQIKKIPLVLAIGSSLLEDPTRQAYKTAKGVAEERMKKHKEEVKGTDLGYLVRD